MTFIRLNPLSLSVKMYGMISNMLEYSYYTTYAIIRRGLVVRISAFHAGGPGSIPGVGIILFFQIHWYTRYTIRCCNIIFHFFFVRDPEFASTEGFIFQNSIFAMIMPRYMRTGHTLYKLVTIDYKRFLRIHE